MAFSTFSTKCDHRTLRSNTLPSLRKQLRHLESCPRVPVSPGPAPGSLPCRCSCSGTAGTESRNVCLLVRLAYLTALFSKRVHTSVSTRTSPSRGRVVLHVRLDHGSSTHSEGAVAESTVNRRGEAAVRVTCTHVSVSSLGSRRCQPSVNLLGARCAEFGSEERPGCFLPTVSFPLPAHAPGSHARAPVRAGSHPDRAPRVPPWPGLRDSRDAGRLCVFWRHVCSDPCPLSPGLVFRC